MTEFSFSLHKADGAARLGTVRTLHGDIRTPAFMPVGTVGTAVSYTHLTLPTSDLVENSVVAGT